VLRKCPERGTVPSISHPPGRPPDFQHAYNHPTTPGARLLYSRCCPYCLRQYVAHVLNEFKGLRRVMRLMYTFVAGTTWTQAEYGGRLAQEMIVKR
jgi:hypothetical protein